MIGNNLSPESLEMRIGYVFRNKTLLETALTHSSFTNEKKARGESADGTATRSSTPSSSTGRRCCRATHRASGTT